MRTGAIKYCLDANVLIEAWHKNYSPAFCPDYWDILAELGKKKIVFLPESVYDEITRTEDELAGWLKADKLPVLKISEPVTICLKEIYSVNPKHRQLVDSAKARSLADPWLIAHAIHERATVVTREEKVTALNAKRIKILNVCDNLGVRCHPIEKSCTYTITLDFAARPQAIFSTWQGTQNPETKPTLPSAKMANST